MGSALGLGRRSDSFFERPARGDAENGDRKVRPEPHEGREHYGKTREFRIFSGLDLVARGYHRSPRRPGLAWRRRYSWDRWLRTEVHGGAWWWWRVQRRHHPGGGLRWPRSPTIFAQPRICSALGPWTRCGSFLGRAARRSFFGRLQQLYCQRHQRRQRLGPALRLRAVGLGSASRPGRLGAVLPEELARGDANPRHDAVRPHLLGDLGGRHSAHDYATDCRGRLHRWGRSGAERACGFRVEFVSRLSGASGARVRHCAGVRDPMRPWEGSGGPPGGFGCGGPSRCYLRLRCRGHQGRQRLRPLAGFRPRR
mmetsp:Transcript_15378/g.42181  ORF Transcript_15378/g.42181 Transcript_15378/m.42181 type:complete len:311 (-) Transcript_15378:132-1064(-)